MHAKIRINDIVIVEDYYRRRGHKIKVTMDNIRELYKDMKMTSLMEEIDEDQKVPLKFIGFRILIASDLHFKHLIYDKNFKIDFKNLDNFSFALDDLFESWVNVYEGYYMARVMFIDRILGVQIVSNPVMLGPEWVKYMVNSTNERILEFDNLDGKSMPTIGYDNKENDNEEDNMFNFIENVRCVVNTTSREGEGNVIRGGNAPKVLYKPIFYRAGTLQNIKIRANIRQKIGINLAEFMTKVETFKLIFNESEYIEYGRNDAFVIFDVVATNLTTTGGMYDIYNQDDEYISSGNYTVI